MHRVTSGAARHMQLVTHGGWEQGTCGDDMLNATAWFMHASRVAELYSTLF